MESICNPPNMRKDPTLFRRGDKIHFYGKDSKFQGYFLHYIEKLPMNFSGGLNELIPKGEKRCVVQQKETGIILVKPAPTLNNAGWRK